MLKMICLVGHIGTEDKLRDHGKLSKKAEINPNVKRKAKQERDVFWKKDRKAVTNQESSEKIE